MNHTINKIKVIKNEYISLLYINLYLFLMKILFYLLYDLYRKVKIICKNRQQKLYHHYPKETKHSWNNNNT